MNRNNYLVFCGKVMEVMTKNNVPIEVQNQIAQIIQEYKDNINKQVNQIMLEAQKLM